MRGNHFVVSKVAFYRFHNAVNTHETSIQKHEGRFLYIMNLAVDYGGILVLPQYQQ